MTAQNTQTQSFENHSSEAINKKDLYGSPSGDKYHLENDTLKSYRADSMEEKEIPKITPTPINTPGPEYASIWLARSYFKKAR